MNQLMAWLSLIRWPNVIIVVLVQAIFYYHHVLPLLSDHSINPFFDTLHVALFILCTALVTSIGNILNDLVDVGTDLINKPKKIIVDRLLSENVIRKTMWVLVAIGALIAAYLAYYVNHPLWFLFYPSTVGGLWLYSYYFKGIPVLGNLIISLFCVGAFGIILLLELNGISQVSNTNLAASHNFKVIIFGFSTLAFFITWARELVKDMEDLEGDLRSGWDTMPVRFGIKASLWATTIIIVSLIGLTVYWILWRSEISESIITLIGLILPLMLSLYLMWKFPNPNGFGKASSLLKLTMLAGLIYLYFI